MFSLDDVLTLGAPNEGQHEDLFGDPIDNETTPAEAEASETNEVRLAA